MLDKAAEAKLAQLPSWRGECVAIIGAGASAKTADLTMLRDRIHVVAVNTSYELVPWADMLYSCDLNWWSGKRGAKDFGGIKVTQDASAVQRFPDLIRIEVAGSQDELRTDRFGYVGAGGNSGFQAFNLAVQMRATGIMLIGLDFKGEHWHGRHLPPMTNPDESNFIRWRKAFDGAATKLTQMGIDVVNCSPFSTIKAYPRMMISEALARWQL